MPVIIDQASVDISSPPPPESSASDRPANPPPDIERILRDLRRVQGRLERLRAD